MQFLFLIGVEGSGHHMLRDVLRRFLSNAAVVDKGDYYPLLEQRWDVAEERLPFAVVRREMQRILEYYETQGVTHVYEDTSFPFNRPRNALRRPDIIDLYEMLQGLVDVKILLLYRNPISTVYSVLRRGFSTNATVEARTAENSHLYIERQVMQLPRSAYRTVAFENFVSNHAAHLRALAHWWSIPWGTLADGSSRIVGHCTPNQIPDDVKGFLSNYFDPLRLGQWEGFYQSNPLI